ncbi:MAG TPA: M24 family metallopeptidase [Candidatus Limnocylindrales bacterium]
MSPAASVARPSIPATRYAVRIDRAREAAAARGVAALLVGAGADLRYLTGYQALLTERLTMLVLPAAGRPADRPALIAPRLEAMAAEEGPAARAGAVEVVAWDETDDVHALVGGRVARGGEAPRVLLSDQLWAMHVLGLQRFLGDASFGLATEILRALRMSKDPEEIALLRLAARAADRVVDQIASGRLVGRTEAEVAREVLDRLLTEGHDLAEFAIVGSGPNSASPHHEASDRVIEAGEPIVLDIGGTLDGYWSDTTRTLWVTGGDPDRRPDADFLEIFGLVRDANAAATATARPGVACEEIDAAARRLIVAGGYGDAFIHRTGHGIGLEVHEEPYIVAGNREPLREGVAFSVEPGIYLAGRFGARIEDIVVCGRDGPIVLNESSHDLRVVDG